MTDNNYCNIAYSLPYTFIDDELKEDFSSISVRLDISTQSGTEEVEFVNTKESRNESEFLSNYWAWNNDKVFRSVNNFSSSYFDAIVKMKEDAVPYIYKELKKGPTPLVHALDFIYEGEMEYEGYLPLDFVCKIWLEILKKKGITA